MSERSPKVSTSTFVLGRVLTSSGLLKLFTCIVCAVAIFVHLSRVIFTKKISSRTTVCQRGQSVSIRFGATDGHEIETYLDTQLLRRRCPASGSCLNLNCVAPLKRSNL